MSHHNIVSSQGGRNRSSEVGIAVSQSPTSTSRRSSSSSSSASSSHSTVKTAAKSVAGIFIGCFTTPKSSVSSDTRISGSEKSHSAARGIYVNTDTSGLKSEPQDARFTMSEIYKATGNFSPALKIGQGGFGTVYKGTLSDGTVVAIKRAKKDVHDVRLGVEFWNEIKTLAQVEHLSLVKFYGYLEEEDERVIVVEYVPNGCLRGHLDGIHGHALDMATRLDIAIDVAHAITYLHMYTDHPIIHRDIKSSNILLTENHRAKVADFGFARMAADTDSGATHVITQVKGTAGYLDPEYLKTYQLTEKSDVYSFGIVLVELVTGRRPIESKRELKERLTAKWAIGKFIEGDTISVMDPRLKRNEANNQLVKKILELAFKCIAPHRKSRPTMGQCAEMLWSMRKDYRELSAMDVHSPSTPSIKITSTVEE